jgi:hypothetical protein
MRSLACVLVVALGASSALAQQTLTPLTSLTVRPASAPVPALKYRLAPPPRDLVPGNAAIFYHRAILMVKEARAARQAEESASPKDRDEAVYRWISGPLSEVHREEARKELRSFQNALHEVELGARRRDCDWEFDQRDEGYRLLLPDIQASRELARLVTLRARLAVLDGQTDEAIHWLQVGLTLGRHVGHGTIFIQDLVGLAITNQMMRPFEDLIQAKGTPSLYWALANRPRPWVDPLPAFDGERTMLEQELPALRDLDGPPWSAEKARRVADEILKKIGPLAEVRWLRLKEDASTEGPPSLDDLMPRLTLAGVVLKVYPEARRALIAEGIPAAQVDAMPTFQVALLNAHRKLERLNDDMYKWVGLPYWQSYDRLDEAMPRDVETKLADPLFTMFTMLTPALNSVRVAGVRTERLLDAYQVVEALRLHAAAHDGKFPTGLDSLKDAPAPLDPATGKPFDYKVEGETATLSAPLVPGGPDHPLYKLNCSIRLAR